MFGNVMSECLVNLCGLRMIVASAQHIPQIHLMEKGGERVGGKERDVLSVRDISRKHCGEASNELPLWK